MLRAKLVRTPSPELLQSAYAIRADFVAPAPGVDPSDDQERFRSFFADGKGILVSFEKGGRLCGFFAYAKEDYREHRWVWIPYMFFRREARRSLLLPLMFIRVLFWDLLFRQPVLAATVYPDAWSFMENACGVTGKSEGSLPAWMFDYAGISIEGTRYDPLSGVAQMLTVPRYDRVPSSRYAKLNPNWRAGFAVVALRKFATMSMAEVRVIVKGLLTRSSRSDKERIRK